MDSSYSCDFACFSHAFCCFCYPLLGPESILLLGPRAFCPSAHEHSVTEPKSILFLGPRVYYFVPGHMRIFVIGPKIILFLGPTAFCSWAQEHFVPGPKSILFLGARALCSSALEHFVPELGITRFPIAL